MKHSILFTAIIVGIACDTNNDDVEAVASTETTEASDASGTTTGADISGSTGENGDAGSGQDDTRGSGGSGDTGYDARYDCVETDFQVLRPLSGKGYDPETGELIGPLQERYMVSTTQLLVKPEKLSRFLELTQAVTAEFDESDGIVGISLASEPNCGFFRTLTVWKSEQSMFDAVLQGTHITAIQEAGDLSITGRTTFWEVPGAEFPMTWEAALEGIADVPPVPGY